MNKIDRGYETMTSKRRFLRTINYEKPDRVPINYHSNPGVDGRLKAHFGLDAKDGEGLARALGVDFRSVKARYTGKPLHTSNKPDRAVDPQYGWVLRYVEHGSGGYWDYCDFPLITADEETVANWKFPDPDDFDYDSLPEQTRANSDFALYLGNAGLGCIINTAGFLRGMEQTLVDLITDDPAGLLLIEKMMDFQYKVFERELDKVGKSIDFVWMGEDLGSQRTPLISMDIFKKHILPVHAQLIGLAASYGLPVMLHTCGSSSWAYEEYIGSGLKGVDTLQPEAAKMEPRYLKDTFGGRLFFHGCISTAGPLAFGTLEETVQNCKDILDIMMPGYGYCFSPTHSLQDNSPTENVIAAYKTAHTYGRYD
jgi:uroporphyrinogen decarboxylase